MRADPNRGKWLLRGTFDRAKEFTDYLKRHLGADEAEWIDQQTKFRKLRQRAYNRFGDAIEHHLIAVEDAAKELHESAVDLRASDIGDIEAPRIHYARALAFIELADKENEITKGIWKKAWDDFLETE